MTALPPRWRRKPQAEAPPSWHCSHEIRSAPRARAGADGAVRHRWQCLDCGAPVGAVVSKARVGVILSDRPVEPFDETLFEAGQARLKAAAEKVALAMDRKSAAWWAWYNQYLQTDKWAGKRQKVLRRARGQCEGCGEAEATAIHHLSYAHVGDELLFELVALCRRCHGVAHDEPDREARR